MNNIIQAVAALRGQAPGSEAVSLRSIATQRRRLARLRQYELGCLATRPAPISGAALPWLR